MNEEEYRLPRYKEIPDVGLLLDQVARLINGYLESYQDIRLTNSMISNYVKHNIIARPVRKLYYREQIASLVFIAVAKTVLSLDDIDTLLRIQRQNHTPEAAYNTFCKSLEKALCGGDDTDRAALCGDREEDAHGAAAGIEEEDHSAKTKASALNNEAEDGIKTQNEVAESNHAYSYEDDSYLLHSLIKAVADSIRLRQMLAARR